MKNRLAPPPHWQPTDKTIHRTFQTGNFDYGVSFISAIAKLAQAANHHPDIILTHPTIIVTLTTHDEGKVTDQDIRLAEKINELWIKDFS